MAKLNFNSNSQNISHFRVRLVSKLVVIFICMTLLLLRVVQPFIINGTSTQYDFKNYGTTVPFLTALSLIVLIEYLLYRKLGIQILKYSIYFDIAFILVQTGEWMLTLYLQLSVQSIQCDGQYAYSLYNAIGFANFAWRALESLLMTRLWYLRIIPPTAAYIYLAVYGAVHVPSMAFITVFRTSFQIVYVILIYYCEARINFTLMIGNVQQQQWLQLNDFILNNIPENIAIMDPSGNPSFISENFKKLMQSRNQSPDIKTFLGNIKHIKRAQQDQETESDLDCFQEILPLERGSSNHELPEELNYDMESLTSLEDLIILFGNSITKGIVKEKYFQIFTGKFHQDEEQERSFEIKMSFINQQPKKYILLILRDTTQRDLVLTLEGNIKYKDQLLASVSHELRTPLNGNINLIEAALKSKDIPDTVKQTFLTPAVRSSQFLLHLINDILDMSQMKAQKLRLIFQQANLRETLINTIQLLELHAKKKCISLELNIDPNLPEVFCTDHVRLSQIVLNLINNSIKFTQKGHVKLSAFSPRDSGIVNVSVEDTGIGMSEEDRNKLFKDFTHIDFKNREKINPTGVGLGLKIANDLAKLLGPINTKGISVTSEVGSGSTFAFLIENKETGLNSQETRIDCKDEFSPLVANEFYPDLELGLGSKIQKNMSPKSICSLGKINIPSMISIPSCNCTCPKVLVVDDDPFNILAYEAILNSLGVKYDCVYNGRSAINKMLNKVRYPCSSVCRPYKVVFMDEEMPDMTGRETVIEIVRLQQQNLLPQVNIIGCTAHHDGDAIESFLKSGIAEYLPKPVSSTMLQKILEKYNA